MTNDWIDPLQQRRDALREAAKNCKECRGSGERVDGGPCVCVPEDQLSELGKEVRRRNARVQNKNA